MTLDVATLQLLECRADGQLDRRRAELVHRIVCRGGSGDPDGVVGPPSSSSGSTSLEHDRSSLVDTGAGVV